MIKTAQLICLAVALALGGCATPSSKNPTVPDDWQADGAGGTVMRQPPAQAVPMQPSKPSHKKPEFQTEFDSASIWPSENATESWITLDHWCQLNRLSPPLRTAATVAVTYLVNTPRGTLTLHRGSRLAQWNGLEIQLGFAPREVEGRLLVHVLDARKNFQPLLEYFAFPPQGSRTIVVDPGHGGGNNGTKSLYNQHFEKEYTLDWALRLRPLLEAQGWKVLLTRTNDIEIPLGDRVMFAEKAGADFFLSLHFNAAVSGLEQAGLETYCVTPKGMPSNLTREYEDDAGKTFPNNAFDEQNYQCAVRLHRAVLKANGGRDRGVRRARFMGVLNGQNRPAVLIEGGYLSNTAEAKRVADPEFRQRLAEAVASALQ